MQHRTGQERLHTEGGEAGPDFTLSPRRGPSQGKIRVHPGYPAAGLRRRLSSMDTTMNPSENPSSEPPRSAAPPASTEAGVASPKRIYRDPRGPLGGVASGFAGYFDVDPVISRLLWIVAALSGIGIPAYLVCWVVIPKAKAWPPPGYGGRLSTISQQGSTALLSGFVIVALAAAIGAGSGGIGQYVLPAALVGFGVYLLNQRASGEAARESDPLREDTALSVGSEPAFDERGSAPWAAYARGGSAAGASSPQARLVTPTVLSVLALGAGIAAALHTAGLVHVSIAAAAAAALVVVGVALLASLWLGPVRGLVPLGLGLMCIMLAASTFAPWFGAHDEGDGRDANATDIAPWLGQHGMNARAGGGVGDKSYAPHTLDELAPSYALGVGKLTLDLSRVDFSGDTRQLEVKVGIGEVLVIVPDNTAVEVHGNVGIGEAEALDERMGGLGARVTKTDDRAAAGKLVVDFNVGIGKGHVQRASVDE
jgi:phage shock protein PspC (stress-responsive transcriptional regulator)